MTVREFLEIRLIKGLDRALSLAIARDIKGKDLPMSARSNFPLEEKTHEVTLNYMHQGIYSVCESFEVLDSSFIDNELKELLQGYVILSVSEFKALKDLLK